MKKLYLSFLVTAVICSCQKESNDEPGVSAEVLQPLEVGYSWTFIDSTFTKDGLFSFVDTSTLYITGDEYVDMNGKETLLFYWKWDFHDRTWLKANEDGSSYVYGIRENDKNHLIAKFTDLPYPVILGDKWKRYIYVLTENNGTITGSVSDAIEYQYIRKDYAFNTHIGVLECFVAVNKKVDNESIKTYTYFCSEIGFVGLENKENNVVTFKKTLLNYDFTKTKEVSFILNSAHSKHQADQISDCFGVMYKK